MFDFLDSFGVAKREEWRRKGVDGWFFKGGNIERERLGVISSKFEYVN